MELAQYRAAQDRESRSLLTYLLRVLAVLTGRPVSDEQVTRLSVVLYPTVVASRQRSFELARQVILELNPGAPEVPVPPYLPEFLAKTLRRHLADLDDPIKAQRSVAQTAAAVVRHTEQAGREGMISMVRADNARWARVARGGRTCSFCVLLVSRGPVYARETATFQSHPRCDCIAVPVYDRNNWYGREQYLAAEKLYVEATAGERDKLNAFRRAMSEDARSVLPAAA